MSTEHDPGPNDSGDPDVPDDADPSVPTDLLDLYVQLEEEGLTPDEFRAQMSGTL